MRKIFLILIFSILLAPAQSAFATKGYRQKADDLVVGHPQHNYRELFALMGRELTQHGGSFAINGLNTFRNLAQKAAPQPLPEQLAIPAFEAVALKAPGQDWVALLVDFGAQITGSDGYAVLALFDMQGAPRLLDAANVAEDKRTDFDVPARIALGDGADILVVDSEHSISNKNYSMRTLFSIRGGKFSTVDRVETYSDKGCGFTREQLPFFRILKREPGSAFRIEVTETIRRRRGDCTGLIVPKHGKVKVRVDYAWDGASKTYVRNSDAVKDFAAETKKRF